MVDHPKSAAAPSVTSTGQRNGVTAGYVENLTQNVLPSLVRGPQLEKMKSIFVDGAKLRRDFFSPGTDDNIDQLCNRADQWANGTFLWLNEHVSAYAAERFAFRPTGPSYAYSLKGEHAAGYADKWGSTNTMLSEFLVNLDQLMRDPSIYAEK